MKGVFDLYTERSTFLHRLDPRVKILAVLFISLLGFILTNLIALLILLAFILLLLYLSRSTFSKAYFALKFVIRLMLLIIVLWPFFDQSGLPVLFTLGPIKFTEPALLRGATSAIRIGCLATVWYILMFTTTQRDLVRALVKMGLRYDYGLALAISLRFIPTFGYTIESIKDAQRARGLEFDKGSVIRRSKNYISVLVPSVIYALKTAETLSLSLQSRAYGARKERTYMREIQMRRSDVVALIVVILIFSVPAVAKFVFGTGI